MKELDIVNQKIGKLLILEYLGNQIWKSKNGKERMFKQYKCLCECGNVCNKKRQDLLTNNVKSCGCLMDAYFKYLKERENPNKLPTNHAAINRMYDRYKINAEKRDHDFLLTKEDLKNLIFNKCYYCNQDPYSKQSLKQSNGNPLINGIDRIDNNIGYTEENCIPCCKKCNFAKHKMSKEEFLDLIKLIYDNLLREK